MSEAGGTGVAARMAAAALLDGVLGEGRRISELTGQGGSLEALSDPADRARAQRLARETLRHLDRADRLLAQYLRKTPPLAVRNLLRTATMEMLELHAPPHAVVNAAVEAARGRRQTAHAAGLVNAVLRKAADAGEAWAGLPPQRLPGWLRGRLLSAYGGKAVAAIERAHAAGAPLDLTARDGDGAALAARLGGMALPTGSVRLAGREQVTGLAGYDEGAWWVQDAAAALPARILAPRPEEKVIDLCAAPGGKTLQLAAAGARVTAVDLSAERMARLEANLRRTGLSAETVVADLRDWRPKAPPQAILLDAPCTATGTIRRNPEVPMIRSGKEVAALAALQAELLDRAISFLTPGGRLVFCTCSLLPEEGEDQLAAALARHGDLTADPEALLVPGVEPGWRTPGGGLRMRPDYWPEAGGMDGFFVALIRRGA